MSELEWTYEGISLLGHPANEGDNFDDKSSDDDNDDDDVEKDEEDEEEEEHLAPADPSTAGITEFAAAIPSSSPPPENDKSLKDNIRGTAGVIARSERTETMKTKLEVLEHVERCMPKDKNLGSFDAIIGMDWLAKYQAIMVCAEKIVRIPWGNETLIIHGDGVNPGKKELSEQLKELSDKGFIRPFTPRGAPVLFLSRSSMDHSDVIDYRFECLLENRPKVKLTPTRGSKRRPFEDLPQELGNKKEHEEHLKLIIELLKKEELYAKFSKCEFWIPKVQFLGHVIDSEGIHVDPTKIESIKDWTSPKVFELTQKKVKFEWGDKQEAAFQLLKQKLCSAPILALPEGSEDFIAYCDASKKGLGAVLMQREKVISYASRQLVYGVHRSQEFAIYFRSKRVELNIEQRDGLELTMDYDCDIRYHPGKANVVADALSRKEREPPLRVRSLRGKDQILGPELDPETTREIIQIKQRMQAARDRQKSYADLKPYVGPFKVIERVGEVAYKLELPENERVHYIFQCINMKKCHADETISRSVGWTYLDDYFILLRNC
ncbi:putative reverse transcriptase domain-containing protein [Tanacetum coccineum]